MVLKATRPTKGCSFLLIRLLIPAQSRSAPGRCGRKLLLLSLLGDRHGRLLIPRIASPIQLQFTPIRLPFGAGSDPERRNPLGKGADADWVLLPVIVEHATLSWLGDLGWGVVHGPDIGSETPVPNVPIMGLLETCLQSALVRLNPALLGDALAGAIRKLTRPEGPTLESRNRQVHRMFVDGVPIERSSTAARRRLRPSKAPSAPSPPPLRGDAQPAAEEVRRRTYEAPPRRAPNPTAEERRPSPLLRQVARADAREVPRTGRWKRLK